MAGAQGRRDLDALVRERAGTARVIFSDLDGTLLAPDGTLPPGLREAVARLALTGVHFVPATGRTLWSAREALGDARGGLDIVAGNGMDVIVGGRVLRHLRYARADLEELVACALADPARPGVMAYDDRRPYLIGMDPALLGAWSLHNSERPSIACLRNLPPGDITKVALIARDDIDGVVARYARRFAGRLTFAACGRHWIDVPLPGAGKGEGARAVLDELGAAPETAIAFGDSMNDESLMREVGASVAVGNALPALKPLCAYEIGTNAEGSVVRAMERIAAWRASHPCAGGAANGAKSA